MEPVPRRRLQRLGVLIFGTGWALLGYCPGTSLAERAEDMQAEARKNREEQAKRLGLHKDSAEKTPADGPGKTD